MPRVNRDEIFADDEIQVFHLVNRCVRRTFLCEANRATHLVAKANQEEKQIEPPTLELKQIKKKIEPPTLTGVWGNNIVRPSICQRFLVWGGL